MLRWPYLGAWLLAAFANALAAEPLDKAATFDAITDRVRDEFFDERLATGDWLTWAEAARLDTSHTHFYSLEDPRRYQMLGIFTFLQEEAGADATVYAGIGIGTVEVAGRVHVASVFDGFPAEALA
ncbi:MAG: hypothetical protein AAGA68_26585 [Pseudomonadota bacterium]